jgi:hypothetical protein
MDVFWKVSHEDYRCVIRQAAWERFVSGPMAYRKHLMLSHLGSTYRTHSGYHSCHNYLLMHPIHYTTGATPAKGAPTNSNYFDFGPECRRDRSILFRLHPCL